MKDAGVIQTNETCFFATKVCETKMTSFMITKGIIYRCLESIELRAPSRQWTLLWSIFFKGKRTSITFRLFRNSDSSRNPLKVVYI